MNPLARLVLTCVLAVTPALATAQSAPPAHGPMMAPMPYPTLDASGIKGLTEGDIAALEAGDKMGQALAAELNGAPSPADALDQKEALELSDQQVAAIEAVQAQTEARAKQAGQRLIRAEAMLEDAFRRGGLNPQSLNNLVMNAGRAWAEYRLAHLTANAQMPYLLTRDQMASYHEMTGYEPPNPCNERPEGADEDMWNQHFHCETE